MKRKAESQLNGHGSRGIIKKRVKTGMNLLKHIFFCR